VAGSRAWPAFVSRLERLGCVDSTQRVVREWLDAGVPEVCFATADEQTAGRGRLDRRWLSPPGAALLVSAGFRPSGLAARHAWRLAALVSLAMLEAIEDLALVSPGSLRLKWPNDLVVGKGAALLKLGGVLGEVAVEGERVASAVVGLGVNVDWRAPDFPPALAGRMTSLREMAGRRVDREGLLQAWLERLGGHHGALATGRFPARAWVDRQVTTGAHVEVDTGDRVVRGTGLGVDPEGGGLIVLSEPAGQSLTVLAGDVLRCEVRAVGARL
jgi:BirA family transcriptional regulator, biotin operon repressor / biotin---[acetyl-CoA-carboxylase] ligase